MSITSDNMSPKTKEPARTEHFELAQGARDLELCPKSNRVVKLSRVQSSIDKSKFMRLSSESFPDLKGAQIQILSDLCLKAHRAEDFYLNDATDQFVRTSIASAKNPDELFCSAANCSESNPSITIHSNVLPCELFLTKLDQTSKKTYFPCSLLKKAMDQTKSLDQMLLEWKSEECELSQMIHGSKTSANEPSRRFWEIQDDEVVFEKEDRILLSHAEGVDKFIWWVTWRGGRFVKKDLYKNAEKGDTLRVVLDRELHVTEKLSHPHIVYSFGVSLVKDESSLFMERMQNDLHVLIREMGRRNGNDNELPPFSHQDSVDILLQFAEAMVYMHGENVVHGDLKSQNIFVSEFVISDNVTQYLVKVGDLGSAQIVPKGKVFEAGAHTTNYAAPELLNKVPGNPPVITNLKAIDVYSFGIIAFEVLTGAELYPGYRPSVLKKAIIGETMTPPMRPPLREECQKHNFLQDDALLSLIERCWDGEPSNRPSFSDVIDELKNVQVRLLESWTSRSGRYLRQIFSSVAQNVTSLFTSVVPRSCEYLSCTPRLLVALFLIALFPIAYLHSGSESSVREEF